MRTSSSSRSSSNVLLFRSSRRRPFWLLELSECVLTSHLLAFGACWLSARKCFLIVLLSRVPGHWSVAASRYRQLVPTACSAALVTILVVVDWRRPLPPERPGEHGRRADAPTFERSGVEPI